MIIGVEKSVVNHFFVPFSIEVKQILEIMYKQYQFGRRPPSQK